MVLLKIYIKKKKKTGKCQSPNYALSIINSISNMSNSRNWPCRVTTYSLQLPISMPFIETKLYMKKAILGLHSNAAFSLLVTSNYNKPTKTFYGGARQVSLESIERYYI